MSWKKGRPEGWEKALLEEVKKIPDPELLKGDMTKALLLFSEAGADAMHKADLEFLGQFPDLILTIKATMTKEEWLAFAG